MENPNNSKKTSRRRFLIFFIFLIILAGIYIFYAFIFRKKHEPSTTAQCTTQESSYNFKTQRLLLSLTPEVKKAAFKGRAAERDYGTYIVPGLLATETQIHGQKFTSDICTSMTPQGLTVTEDYLLVSAYCQTGTHNSVIYVIDKQTHKFIKEIVLRNKSHVGGLAYDSLHQNIWICGMSNGLPQVNAITMDQLKNYCFQEDYAPVKFSQTYELYAIARTSFITYYNNCLYVGYFTSNHSSVLEEYQILDDGTLDTQASEDTLESTDTPPLAMPSDTRVIEEQAQGLTFYKGQLLFSHSYGMKSSYLQVFSNSHRKLLESSNAIEKIRFPSRMEQICVDGDDLYVLFESAAYAYKASSLVQLDRILKLDLNKLLS